MTKKIAIVGKGGFGREVRFLIDEINKSKLEWDFIGYFDDDTVVPTDGYPLLGSLSDLNNWTEKICVVFAIGSSFIREKIYKDLNNSNLTFPNLIHPKVQLDDTRVYFGIGNIICGGSILTTNISIGNFMILNLVCTIGHDVIIGDFCSVMPGVNISGGIEIGNNCFIGTGAKLINDKIIGNNVIVGAGAVIIKDVPNNAVIVGNPGKIIRINEN